MKGANPLANIEISSQKGSGTISRKGRTRSVTGMLDLANQLSYPNVYDRSLESYTFAQIEFSATKLSVITSNVVKQARLERMAVARTFVQFIYANSFKHVPLTRSVENMARVKEKSIASIVRFFFFFLQISLASVSSFRRGPQCLRVFEASDPREGRQGNRSRGNSATFQKRLTSPRDIRTRNFLLFSKLILFFSRSNRQR